MKLSTKCRYGMRAVLEIAGNFGKDPIKRRTISRNQGISDSYLESILISLKNAGVIYTVRGANGGYALRRPPEDIDLLEVFNALEGEFNPVDCLGTYQECGNIELCITRKVWKSVQEAVEGVLRGFTLKALLDEHALCQQALDYQI